MATKTARDIVAAAISGPPSRMFIVRHGATRLNGESGVSVDRERGWSNVPLTEEGAEDARKAAQKLKGKDIDAIVSSDLNRAKETAAIIGDVLDLKPAFSGKLRPWDLGTLTGQTMSKVTPQLATHIRHPDVKVPEGESFNEFRRRVFEGLAEAVGRHRGKRVLFVCHHRVERLIEAWEAKGQPITHDVDVRVFLEKGDPPGGIRTLKTHLVLLNGALDDKLSHAEADYGPGKDPEFCRTCEYSDHMKPKPHCALVQNIERGGWCRLWEKAKA